MKKNKESTKCLHKHLLMGLLTVITLTAVFLHMLCHLIPIIITMPGVEGKLDPILHSPIVMILAWSFLPVMIYHMWKDRKMHAEIHRLESENRELKEKLK